MKTKISVLFALGFMFLFSGCSTTPMNDFFGIQMKPEAAKHFKIVSYSDEGGVQYGSTFEMNPHIYAYADIKSDFILIKVINDSKTPIPTNYNEDEFSLVTTDGNKFVLLKGVSSEFPDAEYIQPGESLQFSLYYPNDFAETVGLTRAPFSSTYNKFQVWKADGNLLNFAKDKISEIIVSLPKNITIVLKPIPVKKKS
jgi:hypothetical protein